MAQRMIDEKVSHHFIIVACCLAIVSGLLILVMTFAGAFKFTPFNIIDASFVFGMAYGVYRKSRTCAILLFIYYVGCRFDMYQRTGNPSNAVGLLAIAFTVAFFLGILGTFAVHSIEEEKKAAVMMKQHLEVQK